MARAHWIHVEHDFAAPPERVFTTLGEHERLTAIFPAQIERLRDGTDGTRNGVGSARRLTGPGGLLPFEETVTESVPNQRIVYRITKGTPLDDHVGIQELTPRPDGGTHLVYRIRLASPVPGLALGVKTALTRSITQGLPDLDDPA